jgi:uncharacterized protein (DUF1697 family)
MTTYIAFLRGINLGKRNVKSDELRSIFSGMGFENVRTYIASGNVLFDTKEKNTEKLTKKIENGLVDALGYKVTVFLRSEGELAGILENNPFKDDHKKGAICYISFLSAEPPKDAAKEVVARASDTEKFKLIGRELYMLFYVGFSESVFFKKNDYEKVLGVIATNRNLNTPNKILAMMKKE